VFIFLPSLPLPSLVSVFLLIVVTLFYDYSLSSFLTFNDTKWPKLCCCAVKNLLTHSLTPLVKRGCWGIEPTLFAFTCPKTTVLKPADNIHVGPTISPNFWRSFSNLS